MSDQKKRSMNGPWFLVGLLFGTLVTFFCCKLYFSTYCKMIDKGLYCYHQPTDTLHVIDRQPPPFKTNQVKK